MPSGPVIIMSGVESAIGMVIVIRALGGCAPVVLVLVVAAAPSWAARSNNRICRRSPLNAGRKPPSSTADAGGRHRTLGAVSRVYGVRRAVEAGPAKDRPAAARRGVQREGPASPAAAGRAR